jgi:capsular polysaccharide biosynthesis protein
LILNDFVHRLKKTLLYDTETVHRQPPLNYEEITQNSEPFIRLEETLPACHLCELDKAWVSPYGIVFKNGRVVPESVYSMFVNNRNALTFFKKIFLGKVRTVSGQCLVAHNAYYDNYYHWTLEALPRLYSVREAAPNLRLLIHEKTPAFVDEYLRFFRFRDIVRIKDDEVVRAEKLVLPMHTARGLAHREQAVRDMGKWLRTQAQVPNNLPADKKIFVSREKARYRRAVNESDAYRIFAEHGYEKIHLEEMPLREQIHRFAAAEKVAGIHGAGFSNLLYAHQATLLTDIIHRQHPQDAFYNLACATGSRYLRIECDGVGKETYCGTDDLRVDVKKLENLLNRWDGSGKTHL